MPRDILSEYGKDSGAPQKPRATSGGHMPVRDVMGYAPPQGPANINDPKGPGLHGSNSGHGQKHECYPGSGSPGLHGDNKGHGTNR